MNGPWETLLLLLALPGTIGFGYLGFRQKARDARDGVEVVLVLTARVAAGFWLLAFGVAAYFSLVPLDCTNQGDYCALGRVLLFGLVLTGAGVTSVLVALAGLGYFAAARRSAETE
jgi:hypothetical protein